MPARGQPCAAAGGLRPRVTSSLNQRDQDQKRDDQQHAHAALRARGRPFEYRHGGIGVQHADRCGALGPA